MQVPQAIRRYAIILALLYIPMAGGFTLIKATTPLFANLPWMELIYGPALGVASCFLVFVLAYWIEIRIKGGHFKR